MPLTGNQWLAHEIALMRAIRVRGRCAPRPAPSAWLVTSAAAGVQGGLDARLKPGLTLGVERSGRLMKGDRPTHGNSQLQIASP